MSDCFEKTVDYGKTYKTLEKTKKQWRRNALIFGGVFLLGFFLPPAYKAFAPLLFLIPVFIEVVNKSKQAGGSTGIPSTDHTHSPSTPDRTSSGKTYVYKPKDPKDPRRYKPIG
jgi:hypothetical protein